MWQGVPGQVITPWPVLVADLPRQFIERRFVAVALDEQLSYGCREPSNPIERQGSRWIEKK